MRRTAARTGAALLILFGGLATLQATAAASVKVTIGSKAFTESVILGEMLGLLAREAGAEVGLAEAHLERFHLRSQNEVLAFEDLIDHFAYFISNLRILGFQIQ